MKIWVKQEYVQGYQIFNEMHKNLKRIILIIITNIIITLIIIITII